MEKALHLKEISFVFVSILFVNDCFVVSEANVKDDIQFITKNLKESLINLGKNATQPQPKFGLDSPIDPLVAVAPLRYLHEGDLLKLRLQLNNVSLEGLSSLAVQGVSFNLPEDIALKTSYLSPKSDPSLEEGSSTSKTLGNFPEGIVEEYDYYDEVGDDEYEVLNNEDYLLKLESNGASVPYLDDFSSKAEPLSPDNNEDYDGNNDDYDKVMNNRNNYDDHGKDYEAERKKSYDQDYFDFRRYKRNTHKNSVKPRHSKYIKPRHGHSNKHSVRTGKFLNISFATTTAQPRDILTDHKIPSKEYPLRHHRYKEDLKKLKKSKRTINFPNDLHDLPKVPSDRLQNLPDEFNLPVYQPSSSSDIDNNERVDEETKTKRIVSIPATVRVSFKNVEIKAQYVIRGRAGGVFTFKEQGKLVLTIPNVFLTSQFNVTLIPEFKGLRHWKNSRRNHLRVQKVRSRLSLDVPKLSLIPASRPSEWVRRQLQEKMEELGKGVGKRDGAVRLLLRHWARLLRRLMTKASKQTSRYKI